jgi:2',3'-cyclic-nucleotide 2'-phosphodiesterase
MKLLMTGDIVGEPGRKMFAETVRRLKARGDADFVIANAENVAGGKGITGRLAEDLFAAGADVLTLGDHAWDRKELGAYLDTERRILRPANFAPGCPGCGLVTVATAWGAITVVNLIGRVFMRPYDCPFRAVDALLAQASNIGKAIAVDMHAEATSEKIVMGRYLDGRVSCVVGTHTHVQTSDETILPGGTAYITDLGMTGARDSSLGRDLNSVTRMILTGLPAEFKVATRDPVLEGVIVDLDMRTGKARGITRLRETTEKRAP